MFQRVFQYVRSWWVTRQFRANRNFAIVSRQCGLTQESNAAALNFLRDAYSAALRAEEFLSKGADVMFEEKSFFTTFLPTCRREYRLVLTAAMPSKDIMLCMQLTGWGRERNYADRDLVTAVLSRYGQAVVDLQHEHQEALVFLYENRYAYAPKPLRTLFGDVVGGIASKKEALNKLNADLAVVRTWLRDYVDSAESAHAAVA